MDGLAHQAIRVVVVAAALVLAVTAVPLPVQAILTKQDVTEIVTKALKESEERQDAKFDLQFQEIKILFKHMNANLDKIDARLEKVDARFQGQDAKLDKIDARFEKVDARFQDQDAKIDKIDARFEKIDARFQEQGYRFVWLPMATTGLGFVVDNVFGNPKDNVIGHSTNKKNV